LIAATSYRSAVGAFKKVHELSFISHVVDLAFPLWSALAGISAATFHFSNLMDPDDSGYGFECPILGSK
jgi:hypothetical protein